MRAVAKDQVYSLLGHELGQLALTLGGNRRSLNSPVNADHSKGSVDLLQVFT